jgi:16S rRNA processing protein RimM
MGRRPSGRRPLAFPARTSWKETVVSTSTNDPTPDDGTLDVVVARIGKPHGLRGEVTLDLRTDEPDRRFVTGAVLRAEPPRGSASPLRQVTVASTRWHSSRLLATFEEVGDRTAAEAARGLMLYARVAADESPEDPDEYYDHQLVGLAAYDVDGRPLGEVTGLVHGGAQDLLSIRTPDGRDTLVPFVKQLVPEVDVAGGRVVVADRPGLVAPLPEADE